jgi:uncharacterized protein with FMN-binding domain
MKKNLLFMVILAVFTVLACKSQERTDNGQIQIYEGTAQGYRGLIHVKVRMDRGSIMEITVDSMEDRFVGEAAIETLIDMVIEYNSTDIDVVSGASISSKGFLDAVNNAIMRHNE